VSIPANPDMIMDCSGRSRAGHEKVATILVKRRCEWRLMNLQSRSLELTAHVGSHPKAGQLQVSASLVQCNVQ